MSNESFKKGIWARLTLSDQPEELNEYHTTWLLRLCRRIQLLFFFILKNLPPLYETFVIRDEQRKFLRVTIQFLYGLFIGISFTSFIVEMLHVDADFAHVIGIFSTTIMAIGSVVSSQIRCMSLLVPLRLGSTSGLRLILSVLILLLISGPLGNILKNLEVALHSITCHLWMTLTLIQTRFDLMFAPLKEAFVKIRADTQETESVVQLLDTVKDATNTIDQELTGEDEINQLKERNDYVDTKLCPHIDAYTTPKQPYTGPEFYETRYNWTIFRFSTLEVIDPESFSVPFILREYPCYLSECLWMVGLYPNGKSGWDEFITLDFRLPFHSKFEKAMVKFKASIIDNQQKKVRTKERNTEVIAGGVIGWEEFCKKDQVFRNQLLLNDTLTISIEISCHVKNK